jgi:small-conductance mechanosensitive channel
MTTLRFTRSRSVALLALMLIVPAYAAETGTPAAAAAPQAKAADPGTKPLDVLLAQQAAADQASKASQNQIDQLDDATQQMASKYSRALELVASVNKYNAHLAEQVQAQRVELKSIDSQLATIETTSRDVFPLMEKMVDTLATFVSLDMPFKIEERTKRVETLKGLMNRADVTVSEKYRRILEAYQIEMEYGRTLDNYDATVGADAKAAEIVRLGRVVMMYRLPDGSDAGYWDMAQKQWVSDVDYAKDVEHALKVAKKLGAPDILWVPVPAPVEVQQ